MLKYLLLLGIAAIFLGIYTFFNPADFVLFPKCPFWLLTGYQCPGCGSQRAIHHLLNGHWQEAFRQNALLVISLPYLAWGAVLEHSAWGKQKPELRKFWLGTRAIAVIFVVVVAFAVLRNIVGS